MKLFISWSGDRSRKLAESLRNWIPKVINAVEPWLSASDIDPGSRWSPEIAGQLEDTKFGVICLTSDNLSSTWLHFESGALSKLVDKSKVVPLLLDNNPVDIKGPLSQFQAVKANKDDIKKLMTAINIAVSAAGEKGIDKSMLDEAFDVWWPKLEANLKDIPKSIRKPEESKRSEREMIEEILNLVRRLSRNNSYEDLINIYFSSDNPSTKDKTASLIKLLKYFNQRSGNDPSFRSFWIEALTTTSLEPTSSLEGGEEDDSTPKGKKKDDDDNNKLPEGSNPKPK